MRFRSWMIPIAVLASAAMPALATDVDGPNDCLRDLIDWGDAPEMVPAYPGVVGHFPTCLFPSAPGNQQLACPPISTPPGLTGFVRHVQLANHNANYWLGCYLNAIGPYGIDSEPNGKVNSPAVGISGCDNTTPTDCAEAAFGLTWDQDECWGDGSDAGVTRPVLPTCRPAQVSFTTFNCGPPREVFLNICIDYNMDGDWNDNFFCAPGLCAFEWSVVNAIIMLPPGCGALVSPAFLVGPQPVPGWMRVSISDSPMPADYPWNGTVSLAGNEALGGETEDYPVQMEQHIGVSPSTWGTVKNLYK